MTFHFPALSPTGSTEDVEHTGVRLELITGDVSNTSGNTNMTWKWVHSIQVCQLQGLRCSVSWLTETLPRHKSIVCGISYSCFFCYDEPKSLRRERRIVLRPPVTLIELTKNLTSDFCEANAASTSANLELETCSSVAASAEAREGQQWM